MKIQLFLLLCVGLVDLSLTQTSTSNKDQNCIKDKYHHNHQVCHRRDGRDGKDGKHGIDGRDGVDGRDGRNGREGRPGRNGMNGVDGKDGINGTNGTNGINGTDGTDGKNAMQRNWKECSWNRQNIIKRQGVIQKCNMKKSSAITYLKVIISVNTKVDYCNKCCKRWYVTFNGVECSPVPIDIIVFLESNANHDAHRPRIITGHCEVSQTGPVEVALNVGNCVGYGDAHAETGWNSSTRIYVEEIGQPQA
ncbi:collagen triple helix repeat-containing protein 1-like [Clytia hemisphaerica]|uniref:CTHRC1 C-terminal domain-containing protein n=1 Tax=Clytia hemisphaerica TaxID=252671 RepID=A0A7M5UN48_9CNID